MDYWLLCPIARLQRPDGALCSGPDAGRKCAEFCYGSKMADRLLARYDDMANLLATADVIVSHSKFLIDVFGTNGLDTRKFIYLPNGVDYAKVGIRKDPTSNKPGAIAFGFIGTLLPHKGVHVLIDAFTKVSSEHIRLKIFGGHFEEREYYSQLLEKSAGDGRIEFCGEYDFNLVEQVFQDLDVVVVPSLWYENAPLVISLAQAHGIPAIVSGIGGMAELVKDGVNGITFHVGDSDDLAEKIAMVAHEPRILDALRQRKIPPPRIEAEAFLLESIYSSLVTENGTGQFCS